jgi:tRNA pseudouridine65 synthase
MLPVLFQDDDLIVVNKPSGLLVHRSSIDRQATEFALQLVRDQVGQMVYPVHRLDRPTSGALIFAFSPEVARHFSAEFAEGRIEKTYLALARGTVTDEVLVDYPLKEELDAISDKKARSDKPAQSAITHFKNILTYEFQVKVDKFPTARYSLVQAVPKTGRKHQIRRHLRHLGHPIVGDVKYGCGKHNRFFREMFDVNRLLLACTEICFQHPRDKVFRRVQAPLAEDFRRVADRLGWTDA